MHRSPTVAIVGRPNVGKSTLFNRLIGKRYAITSEIAGTTRDRVSQWWNCNGYEVLLVDTGGLGSGAKGDIEEDVQSQAKIAIESADLIIFITNIAQTLTSDDFTAADILRKSKKPVILVANKCDNPNLEEHVYNIYELGFGEAIAISAIHETGIEKLISVTEKALKELKFSKDISPEKNKGEFINLCILGKPNTGKSSLVNALIGEDKNIVSNIPGTTRDTVDT
ncbi:MAG: GTPase, partial [Candidatus Gracilibacteria bacterium]